MILTARQIIEAIENELDFAYEIEQTGGGVATIFVGGDDQVAIGPGDYDWTDPYASTFDTADLQAGRTDHDGDYLDVADLGELVGAVEDYIARYNDDQAARERHLAQYPDHRLNAEKQYCHDCLAFLDPSP